MSHRNPPLISAAELEALIGDTQPDALASTRKIWPTQSLLYPGLLVSMGALVLLLSLEWGAKI